MRIPPIDTHDGRRAFAFLSIFGGCVVFTIFIAIALWQLRDHPGFIFWLAICAHIQLFLGTGALGWAMGRRMVANVTRDGATFDDRPKSP